MVVLGIMLAIFSLAFTAVYIMTQESQIAERKIRRIRVSYAAQAGMVDGLEQLRKGLVAVPAVGNPTWYDVVGIGLDSIGNPYLGYPAEGLTAKVVVIANGDDGLGFCPVVNPPGGRLFCECLPPVANSSDYCVKVHVTQ
ncbi:MAG: hypothetical protein ABIH08_06625 [Candidatus Omnitrophota bacterium]